MNENSQLDTPAPLGKDSDHLPLEAVIAHKISATRWGHVQDLLQQATPVEEKIVACLEAMTQSLGGEGSPYFREFWQVKQLCLPLFKESIAPKMRSQLWGQYVELSVEAKRLKEILEEQSAFACEQIELAIQSIERDLTLQEALVEQCQLDSFIDESIALKEHLETYQRLQRQLCVFGQFAARVHSLRKEVINTEMRIRIKNRCLTRLSTCADQIFPKRREWIQEISLLFQQDIQKFVETHFEKEELKALPLHEIIEEIKCLQAVAKQLTLNTVAFTETRLALSRCWESVKSKDKERKVESTEKLQRYHQEELDERAERQKVTTLKQTFETLLRDSANLSFQEVSSKLQSLNREMKSLEMSEADRQSMERLGKQIQEVVHAKKVKTLLTLPQDAELALEQLQQALLAHEEKRAAMKQQIEEYRKMLGGSGLDFEQAIFYREMIESDKQKLVVLEREIEGIEAKIEEFE